MDIVDEELANLDGETDVDAVDLGADVSQKLLPGRNDVLDFNDDFDDLVTTVGIRMPDKSGIQIVGSSSPASRFASSKLFSVSLWLALFKLKTIVVGCCKLNNT